MKGSILVLAEHQNGAVDNITWELIGKGRVLADQWETRLAVLLLGVGLVAPAETLKASAADVVLTAQHPGLARYSAELYTTAIAQVCQSFKPAVILMGYTYLGMETGPAVCVRLGGTMVSNCCGLEAFGDRLIAVRPVYGATLNASVALVGPQPYVLSFAKGVLPRENLPPRNAVIESQALTLEEASLRSRILEILTVNKGGIDITKARILVSAGRGIGSPDNIKLVRELASALGGEVACSRPVADMGWLPFAHQVGISASTVAPDVYIACGISGASQHVTAMRDSRLIIAINKDAKAPFFRVAHYGLVGDVLEIVPAIIQQARAAC